MCRKTQERTDNEQRTRCRKWARDDEGKMEESIRIILEAVERAKGVLTQTVADIDRVTAATKQQQTAFTRIKGVLREHDALLFKLRIAAAAAAASLLLLGRQALNNAESLNKQAQALGVTPEALSELRFAARLANISSQDLFQSLNFLQKVIVEARNPASELATLFKDIGIDPNQVKDSITALLLLSDVIKRNTDENVNAAIAQKLLGRNSRETLAFLKQGPAVIREQVIEAKALGNVLSKDVAQGADDANTNITKLTLGVQGLAKETLAPLLPGLIAMTQELINIQKEQIAAGTVATGLSGFLKFLAQIVIVLTGYLRVWATITTGVLFVALNAIFNLLSGQVKIIGLLINSVKGLANAFISLAKEVLGAVTNLGGIGEVFSKLFARDFKGALDAATNLLTGVGKSGEHVADELTELFNKVAEISKLTVTDVGTETKRAGQKALRDIKEIVSESQRLINSIRGGGPIQDEPPAPALGLEEAPIKLTDSKALQGARKLRAQIASETANALAGRKEADADILESGIQTQSALLEIGQKRLEASQIVTSAERDAEIAANKERMDEIDALNVTKEERDQLLEDQGQAHQEKMTAIERKGAADRIKINKNVEDEKIKLLQYNLQTAEMFASAGVAIAKLYGKEGFLVYKALAIAQAVINAALAITNEAAQGDIYSKVFRIAAIVAVTAAQIATIVSTNASFAEGGLVPGAPSKRDNRIATVASGEYIFDSDTVSTMGPTWFARLHHMIRMGELPGFAGGGLVPRPVVSSSFGSATSASRSATSADTQVSIGFVNSRNSQRDFMRQEGVRIVVDELRKRSNRISS